MLLREFNAEEREEQECEWLSEAVRRAKETPVRKWSVWLHSVKEGKAERVSQCFWKALQSAELGRSSGSG